MSDYLTLKVPKRISRLKSELYKAKTCFCFERARIVTESYKKTEGEHMAIRRAKALGDVFERLPIFMRKDELIVGQRSEKLAGRAVYPEYNFQGLTKETTPIDIWEYWQGKSIADITNKTYPERLKLAESELAAGYVTGANSGFGHVIIDYEKALTKGMDYIIDEATELLKTTKNDDEGREFLKATIIASKGLIFWANRYGNLAKEQAESEADPERKAELIKIADICHRVPAQPARTLEEALQSFWFVHISMYIEQYGWAISVGRFDQFIYPFYKKDIDSGLLSQEKAWELILSLWVKFMENVHVRAKDTLFQNLTLGGQDIFGNDQSNELSKLCLKATIALKFNQPALSLRWHPNINPEFWELVLKTVAQGMGLPAIFNDDVIINNLISQGVSIADATDYGLVGCVEPCIPGKQQALTAGGHLNTAKALELALNGGKSMISGKQIGLPTKAPSEFTCFDDLWAAYTEQIEYLAQLDVLATHLSGEAQKQLGYCPLMSALLDDCLKNKRDMVYGGTRYNLSGISIYGPSNTCDSMLAIQKWVCDEKKVSWSELQQMLIADFKGHENIRLMFSKRSPRFGNDILMADELINKINAVHADYFKAQVDSRGGTYTCGVWPVNAHVGVGHKTAATPDGRHCGEPLVDGVGACQGADINGPTALLKSVSRLNSLEHWQGGYTCNIKFSATGIANQSGRMRMGQLVDGFMEMGGQELQINVVDAQTLRAAIKNPEKYDDLVIRVAGYSAYFTQLDLDIQTEIISRNEQRV